MPDGDKQPDLLMSSAEEPVFAAPWEATLFAMTLKLSESGLFTWKEWVELFSSHRRDCQHTYYQAWFATLEELLERRGVITHDALEATLSWLRENPVPHVHTAKLAPVCIA